MKLTRRSQRIKESPTMAITAQAAALRAAGKNIIGLGAGEPDFPSPQVVKDAGSKAIADNLTLYTAVDGIAPLKEAIRTKLKTINRLDYELNEIIVSAGAKQSLFNLCLTLLEEGDEALVPAPYWVSYVDMVEVAGGTPVCISTTKENNFKLQPEQLRAALNAKTRLLFLNSPSNPTGKIYSQAELAALGEVLLDFPQVSILSDEIYEYIIWQGEFVNIVNACPALKERTVIVNGVSKAYAMTGWRIGYAAGPAEVIKAMKKFQSQSTSNPTSLSQYAALAALTSDNAEIPIMNKAFKERHDFVLESLLQIKGIEVTPADGTFYIFPWVGELIKRLAGVEDDLSLCSYLLEAAEIAVVPGSAFGAADFMRISYATSMENLKEAMARLQQACA